MAKKIEILENTLLKLLVRRGDDIDRQNITLSEGELGYVTDSKRLYVGDGTTAGGIITGNKFLGSAIDHTSFIEGVEGDVAYNTTDNALYVKTAAGWDKIAQVYSAADNSISLDAQGNIAVGTLSSQHLLNSNEITGNSIELISGQISLSSTQIKTNRISAYDTNYLYLPQNLNINSVDYSFPVGGLGGANSFLKSDLNGNLTWAAPQSNSNIFFNSSAAAVPVGTVVAVASGASMPTGWLLANGQSVPGADYPDLSAVFGSQYGGDGVNFNLPDYTDTVLVGTTDPASFTAGNLTNSGSDYTTYGVVYFIKALKDSVINPNITITNGLTASSDGADITDTTTSLLDGNIEIGLPVPGSITTTVAGSYSFITKATYTRFWVTGSGSKGDNSYTGGAASTITGILSAPIGTTFDYTVGAGISTTSTDGNPSKIEIGSTVLIQSDGALFNSGDSNAPMNSGTVASSDYILTSQIIEGSAGGRVRFKLDIVGEPSFWGGSGIPGAGSGTYSGFATDTVDGLVKFEWGM